MIVLIRNFLRMIASDEEGIRTMQVNTARSTMRAAKTLCDISGWSLTNLQLQKILYIANRAYLGRNGRQLVDRPFEAWDYGPVCPPVYHECKMYGNKPVSAAFFYHECFDEGPEREVLESVYEALKEKTGAQLVALTHMNTGAWASVYSPGQKGIVIPENAIMKEYESVGR